MTTAGIPTELEALLRTVAINGAYNASRALSKWFRKGVRLTCDGFSCVSLCDAPMRIGPPDAVIAAIHLPLQGDVAGDMLLTFPVDTALQLTDLVMQLPPGTTKTLGDVEQSCLQETGNIVCSAYANSLSKWLRLHIEPGVPRFASDMVCAVVDPLLMEAALDRDEVFLTKTDFLLDQQHLEWGLMLIPSRASWQCIQDRCDRDSLQQHALQTIAVNGAFDASRAMSKWMKRGVKINTEGFQRVPIQEIAGRFDESSPIAAMHTRLGPQLGGHTLLAVESEHARRLADILLDRPRGTTQEFGELERSCLAETGNILVSAFVNSWATWLDMRIEPSPPRFVYDLPHAVIQSALAEQALVADEAYVARTDFLVDDQWLEWVFMMLPSPSAIRLIEASCQ